MSDRASYLRSEYIRELSGMIHNELVNQVPYLPDIHSDTRRHPDHCTCVFVFDYAAFDGLLDANTIMNQVIRDYRRRYGWMFRDYELTGSINTSLKTAKIVATYF